LWRGVPLQSQTNIFMHTVMTASAIHSTLLSQLPGIRHAFFTREGGVSDGVYASLNAGTGSNDDQSKVRENRARMASALGVRPDRLLTCYQIHSPDVITVETPWPAGERPRADAMATRVPNIALAISTADCGPVLFADSEAQVIGGAHAGWRGAFTGVIEATIAAMEKLGAQRSRIAVALGPMIRQQNYEVGPEFVARFKEADAENGGFFAPSPRAGHAMFDLPGYIAVRLRGAGIDQIDDLGVCTCTDVERFYSYRRMTLRGEPDYGRHINAIVLSG
jgi:purine-nucleoside/S-methyl-5'-thioadenosine phosphorylase / adenosine deaminase